MKKLIHYQLCAASRAVRLALAQWEMECALEEVKPWALPGHVLRLHPGGNLPVLLPDAGEPVCGVYAISEFLHESYNRDASLALMPLFPGTERGRAEVRRVADWFLRKFETEVSQYLLDEKVYKPMSGIRSSPDLPIIRAARENLRYHLSYLSYLAEQRKWLAGDELSFADFAAAGQISVLDYLSEIDWSEFPEAKSWYARIKSRPCFRPLLQDRLPGFNPPAAYANLDF
jgi:glutathione S-transferase